MVAARILGYGKDYEVEVDPFSSGTKQKLTIDLTQIEHKEVDYRYLRIVRTNLIMNCLTQKD